MNPYRLERNAIPKRYDITLEPNLETATFEGEVTIAVELANDADLSAITLNAAELEITEAAVSQADPVQASVTFDEPTERVTLQVPAGALNPGPAQIHCRFTGILNDKLRGFYRSTYTTAEGETRTIATTQFESTNARRAFPCFDEPDLKAIFGVTLVVPPGLGAVSCGEQVSAEELPDGRRRLRFADTMVISTYLLAFIVGELETTDPVDVDGVPLRIVHVPGKAHLTDYAVEVGTFALRWLVDYYGIDYPGTKLDLVAVPDFAFGAMENMGCVTFRETLLLADPETSTLAELSRIVDVVAHEIAHMWFGNLVTMDWWNGIWLKEAFATFMQVSTTHAFRPQWQRWDEFSVERAAAFDVDSLSHTRPIEFEVISPADAEGMYDVLTYEKGAAVVRMLEQFLGAAEFRAGVKHYLETHSYGNVDTGDLWDALESSSGQPVRAAMDTWIFQGGYPILDVESTAAGVRLSQQRFAYTAAEDVAAGVTGSSQPTKLGELWHVPVTIRAQLNNGVGSAESAASETVVERQVLLTEPVAEIDLGGACEWITANAGGHGFYRTRYSAELLAQLSQRALEVLDPVERYALVDDAWAAVLTGRTSAAEFVELVTGLGSETDLRVWQRMLGGLQSLYLVSAEPGRDYLSQLIRDLSTTALGVLGLEPIEGESDLDRELRADLFAAAGVYGKDEFVAEQARQLFDETEAVEPNLATAALKVVAASGDGDDYERILGLYRSAATPQLELNYLWALLQFRQVELFERTLELAVTEVRTQNAPFLMGAAMAHTEHGPRAWHFVSQRWQELCQKFPQNSIPRMAGGVRALCTRELADEVTAFFAENSVPQGELIVAQHIEKMWVNVNLGERLEPLT